MRNNLVRWLPLFLRGEFHIIAIDICKMIMNPNWHRNFNIFKIDKFSLFEPFLLQYKSWKSTIR